MKVIITETHQQKMIDAVKKFGFLETVKMLGIGRLRLAQLTNLPIKGDTFFHKDEVLAGHLLKDLVDIDDVYNECDLIWDSMSRTLHWVCRFDDGDQIINTLTYATPYYNDNDMTHIETDNFEVIKDGEKEEYGRMSNNYLGTINSPTMFENAGELINLFEDEYKPLTYMTIKRHLKQFKEDYNL